MVDFCCLDLKLIIEVDGSQHGESAQDAERDAWLAAQGFTVLCFWNNEVLTQSESVRARILATVTALQASGPPP